MYILHGRGFMAVQIKMAQQRLASPAAGTLAAASLATTCMSRGSCSSVGLCAWSGRPCMVHATQHQECRLACTPHCQHQWIQRQCVAPDHAVNSPRTRRWIAEVWPAMADV